jgi:hypothetical protein
VAYASSRACSNDWQKDVARRYTFWPVLLGGSFVWVAALGLLVWGYVRRKARASAKLRSWAREEALEDARRDLALALLRQAGPVRVIAVKAEASAPVRAASADGPRPGQDVTSLRAPRALPPQPSVPKVEHDGGWHTLH